MATNHPTDEQLWELRRQAKDDPRCADQQWFILFARAAIAASQSGVTAAPLEGAKVEIYQLAQWVTAVNCARREPYKDVILEGRTVIAISDALEKRPTPASPQPLAPPPGYALLDEMRAFINLLKGAALLGPKTFTPERCGHIFEECVRLNGRYLELDTAAAPQPPASVQPLAPPDTGNVGAIPELSDDEVDLLLAEIDQIARNYDHHDYGLPTHDDDSVASMRAQVQWFFESWTRLPPPPPGRVVPLTEERIEEIWKAHVLPGFHDRQKFYSPQIFARQIEAAHGIKEGS